ncbi:protein of unknown function [Cellulosimicrobium aquatile]|uniref:DUF937 domain-containing protein n=1 Tax=Cellulosimicrobium aquatile TaxID=1612203 RepID=A0A1N6SKW7_9MICO|nr:MULTISPECIES: DUF937 domain-containing protein [Cellulosimicrobium]MDQ8042721.1 DUF937 domain-containing protein [Cellulosimicrobium sp. XJ-DQ-B-000]SIQ41709.1 protein of unknown function [Cellulosimicrobium aquatile]
MAGIDDILSTVPLDQLAGRLGVDEATAQRAVGAALPALLGGLRANAQDPAGAASLGEALAQHDPALVEGGVDLDDVDTDDGRKIVGHVFGQNEQAVVAQLARSTGTGKDLLAKVLPALAPIALAFLAKQLGGAGSSGGVPTGTSGGTAGGTAAGKGAGERPGASQTGGGGLGDVLGGLLGGGSGAGGGLGDLLGGLGGLLGGGRR